MLAAVKIFSKIFGLVTVAITEVIVIMKVIIMMVIKTIKHNNDETVKIFIIEIIIIISYGTVLSTI